MLAITIRIISDVMIFDLTGRFALMEFSLHDKVKEMLSAGGRLFVVNLADVSYIDSFALGQMFSIWTSIRAKEGKIALMRPNDAVQKVFQTTKLDDIFKIFSDEATAIAYLKQ